jgi:hypothetical protein
MHLICKHLPGCQVSTFCEISWLTVGVSDFSLLQIRSRAHTVFYSARTGSSFRGLKMTTDLYLVPRLGINGVTPPHLLCLHSVHRDKSPFYRFSWPLEFVLLQFKLAKYGICVTVRMSAQQPEERNADCLLRRSYGALQIWRFPASKIICYSQTDSRYSRTSLPPNFII